MNLLMITKSYQRQRGRNPYPWLDADDPRRKMTDQEILEVHRLI